MYTVVYYPGPGLTVLIVCVVIQNIIRGVISIQVLKK